jgi:hypothetical protein
LILCPHCGSALRDAIVVRHGTEVMRVCAFCPHVERRSADDGQVAPLPPPAAYAVKRLTFAPLVSR